jgi:anti-sigma factor (TIGR02949 family)
VIDCSTAVEQLWDFIEHAMGGEDRAKMEEHLAFCKRCCGEVEFAEELRVVLKGAAGPKLPDDAATRLGRFIDEIEEHGE